MDEHQKKDKLDGLLNFLERLFKFGKKTIIFLIIFGFIITIISSIGGGFGSKYFNGHQNSQYFQTYKGPVLSLTLGQKKEGIKASRELTLDFSPWKKTYITNEEHVSKYVLNQDDRKRLLDYYNERYPDGGFDQQSQNLLIKDHYTIRNELDIDQDITVYYPFNTTFSDHFGDLMPSMKIDDQYTETKFKVYTGGQISSGETNFVQYRDVLNDQYLDFLQNGYQNYSHIPATLYEITDIQLLQEYIRKGPNPSIDFILSYNGNQTSILTSGMSSFNDDDYPSKFIVHTYIPLSDDWSNGTDYNEKCYILVIGEDVSKIDYRIYENDSDQELEGKATITRIPTNLEEGLQIIANHYSLKSYVNRNVKKIDQDIVDDICLNIFKQHYESNYQKIGSYGEMTNYNEDLQRDHIFLLEKTIHIPAKQCVNIEIEMEKEPSYDWHSLLETDRDKCGFEFYQNINQFEFDSQKAILEDRQQIRIVSQNFGFDIGNNIKEVPLNDEYYYINVIARKK